MILLGVVLALNVSAKPMCEGHWGHRMAALASLWADDERVELCVTEAGRPATPARSSPIVFR